MRALSQQTGTSMKRMSGEMAETGIRGRREKGTGIETTSVHDPSQRMIGLTGQGTESEVTDAMTVHLHLAGSERLCPSNIARKSSESIL